jgi:hypothetical protein
VGLVSTAMWPARATARSLFELTKPELEATMDQILSGPLPEVLTRALMKHRVPERVGVTLAENGELERLVRRALDSALLVELTEEVLRSEEMQRALGHIAKSPEIGQAIATQSQGLAEEVAEGMRRRAGTLDDVAERTVRGWLGRRPRTT